MKKSFNEYFRDAFNVHSMKKIFNLGGEFAGAIQPLIEDRSPFNIAKSIFAVGNIIATTLELWPEEYFDDGWEQLFPSDFNKLLLKALANKPFKVLKTSDDSFFIKIVMLEDVKVGYAFSTKSNVVNNIYFQADKLERARKLVKDELWKLMKDDNLVLRCIKVPRFNEGEVSNAALEADDAFQSMTSQRATEYSSYLKKCIDAGVPRSVMLYGPPGTGKSTMARTIVNNLGLRSFRIRVEDIGSLETSTIFEAIDMFEPDSIILDDFDRAHEQSALLETLEYFQRHVKLVIATVNDKNRLDEAILRPGRFDELLLIKRMDPDVVKAVLGKEHIDAYETVYDWPIAFIQEYVKRLRFMKPEEAEVSVKELAQRVKRLSKYGNDDSEEETTSLDSPHPTSKQKNATQNDLDSKLETDITLEELLKGRKRVSKYKNDSLKSPSKSLRRLRKMLKNSRM